MDKKTDKLLYNIVIFLLIFALVISIVFTFERLFLEKPINECNNVYQKNYMNDKCEYDQENVDTCYAKEGTVIYKSDCSIECDYCYKEYNNKLENYNNNANLLRIILSFIIALSLTLINIKDKIIKYALLSGSLVSLFVATLMAMKFIGSLLPIVIILEFILVLIIYKKTKEEK
ncbi:hypothetical protein GW835_00985 [archaeon]|nr:hypothetical protein [archaeon]NCP79128.1 hypothetical protein [archaeon]NCP97926.1 hypothetical protein [archaeon]NCQ06895.1 hypothetical protein [archaeon]NCQ50691.1 hypothetical protein [archaeon]